jgi:hypothetical protein
VPPFNGRDKDVIEQIGTGRFRPPRDLKKDIPRHLAAICLKAMRLQPHERYATAKQLAVDLTNWMHDDETLAAPDRWNDRIARFSRRHRALTAVTLASAMAIAAAGALAYGSWIKRVHADQLRAAQKEQSDLVATSFTTALDTFEDLCRPLANGEMNNLGVFRPFADRIDTFASAYLEKFEQTSSMAVHTGRVYELRATVSRVLSQDSSQALRDYQKAEEIYRGVRPGDESIPIELDHRLAQIHLSQGRLHLLRGEFRPAEDMLERARQSLEMQHTKQPDDSSLQRDLAEAYHGLGEVYLDRDADSADRSEALVKSEEYFDRSKDLRRKLVATARGAERRNHQRDLARSLGYLGDLCLAQGDVAQALEDYDRSKKIRQELYNSNPSDPEHRFQLARGLGNFGYLERDYRGNLNHAIEKFRITRTFQEKLAEDFPEVDNFRRDFGSTLNALAEVYLLEAARNSEKESEYAQLASEAVERAGDIFGGIMLRSDKQSDAEGIHGLALSYVLRAVLDQLKHGTATVQLAKQADELLQRLGPEPVLVRSQLVTLAMCRSLQDQPEPAFRTLKSAVDRGEKTVNRFKSHRMAAFRAIAAHPTLGPRLDDLCKQLGAKVGIE